MSYTTKIIKTNGICLIFITVGIGLWFLSGKYRPQIDSPDLLFPQASLRETKYDKYTFENLAIRTAQPVKIEIGETIEDSHTFTSSMFYYYSENRRISGMVNAPKATGVHPVIVMARGYAEKELYRTGTGTKNAAAYYADHGFITFAPDFSGYGTSDTEDEDALGARLAKPAEILDLLRSLPTFTQADTASVYLWGHSNGGQIMLSVAEIMGKSNLQGVTLKGITLWAPVSKPFPYNILYYTDEAEDKGKWLRGEIAAFEKNYDVYKYSIDQYYDWIALPVQIHQGTSDDAVPKRWSDELVNTLKEKEKNVTYFIYTGADHNMRPAWDTVVARDIEFFVKIK